MPAEGRSARMGEPIVSEASWAAVEPPIPPAPVATGRD